MKRRIKILIVITILILLMIACAYIVSHKKNNINKYADASAVCSYNYETDNGTKSKNKLYLYADKDEVLTKVIYVTTQDKDYFYNETINLTRTYIDIYNDVKGVNGVVSETDKKIITTIEYDYKELDVDSLKKINLLDEESIYFKLDFPFTLDEFMIYEVPDYECKLK